MTKYDGALRSQENREGSEQILLVLLPFWTPLIPPLGLSCLKTFLASHGYRVKAVDANVEYQFREVYDEYFQLLRRYVPAHKQTKGNYFYNIGQDVLRHHMMAHLNAKDDTDTTFIQLVQKVVFKTFFCHFEDDKILQLNQLIEEFYCRLEAYFLQLLDKEKPTVLGLSVYSGTLPASMFAFRLTREKYPHVKTLMGGGIFADQLAVDSSDLAYFTGKTPYIDKIIIGEGEILLLKFLRGELPESQKVFTLKDIGGERLNLDSVNVPDFSDFDFSYYPNLTAYASRGCPFQCSFCSETVNWGGYRKKKAVQVAEELIKLYEKHGYQLFLMGDSLLNPVITDLAHELIKKDASLYWDTYLRADKHVCDMQKTFLWRQAGLYRARLGLESGSPKVLQMMGKQITIPQIKEAVSSLACAGVKTTTYWIVGYPGESEADFQQTLQLLEILKDDIYEAMCNPFEYYLKGEVNSNEWAARNKNVLLFPQNTRDLLLVQTWILDCEPSREETFQRVIRFVEHCNQLGIPNPYSINEIYQADERWKKLHQNAVPSLVEFKDMECLVDENKYVEKVVFAENIQHKPVSWDF